MVAPSSPWWRIESSATRFLLARMDGSRTGSLHKTTQSCHLSLNAHHSHLLSISSLCNLQCQGLAVEGRVLPQSLTQEMTPGELKFALEVETALNTIPQPEYRQLVVEALMVLTLVTEHNMIASLGDIICVEHLVHKANQIFLEDQRKVNGDATLCCAKYKDKGAPYTQTLLCGGAAYICQHLYDSAPSGSYGTMTYIAKAVASVLNCIPKNGDMECTIS